MILALAAAAKNIRSAADWSNQTNEMKKLLLLSLLFPLLAAAEILPERLGDFNRVSLEPATISDPEIFTEFGYEEGERGVFQTADGRESVITAYRFYDDTEGYAAYLWNLNEEGAEDSYGERAWVSPGRNLIHFGNYVVEIRGEMPEDEHIEQMMGQYFPNVRMSADPPLIAYMPVDGVANGSQRYILGPTSLARLAPEIPPSVAALNFGVEGMFAQYPLGGSNQRLALFSYPTPDLARKYIEEFYLLPNVVAKRSGPMIAAVLSPSDPDAAQVLLGKVRYRAEVTMNYQEPGRHDNLGTLLLDIVISCAILALLCIAGGIFFAGGRILAARVAPNSILAGQREAMTRLHIDEKGP